MPQAPPGGIDETVSIRIRWWFRSDEGRFAEILDQLRHRVPHRPEHRDGAVQPGELPQPGVRPLPLEERADQRIPRDDQVREGAELDHPILVTGRLGIAIAIAPGLVLRFGLALPGMAAAAGVGEPRMAHVLRDPEVGERFDRLRLAVVETCGLQTRPFLERGSPRARVVIAAGAEQIRRALARVLQSDGSSEAREQTNRTVPVRL